MDKRDLSQILKAVRSLKPKEKSKDIEDKQFFITIVMEEYKALRNEILRSMIFKISIITLGLTSFSYLFSAFTKLNFRIDTTEIIVYLFTIMFIDVLVFLWWLSECLRQRRAGAYIYKLEEKVNKTFSYQDTPAMFWEHWIRGEQYSINSPTTNSFCKLKLFKFHYHVPIVLLSAIFSFSFCLMVYVILQDIWMQGYCVIIITVSSFVLSLLYPCFMYQCIYKNIFNEEHFLHK